MIAYLDASALVKLVVQEEESEALRTYLASYPPGAVTSELSRVEVIRVAARSDAQGVVRARRVLADLRQVPLDTELLDDAAHLGPPSLPSSDAIHLAAARRLGPALGALVTYDGRMADAARSLGLPVEAPA